MLEGLRIILRFKIFQIYYFFWTVREYLCCPSFAQKDFVLFFLYLFSSPYRICRLFWEKEKGQDYLANVPYGETPLSTWKIICSEACIGVEDVLLDLGCGRGRLLFWSLSRIGCRVIGIDSVPFFISRANFLVRILRIKQARFLVEDICSAPLEQATVIYFYASISDDELFLDLAVWLTRLSHRPLIITVGQSLVEFIPSFSIEKEIKQDFGWGQTVVYFQRCRERFRQESSISP
ncbi:class I SAM-dependent methyltransferase [Candidatus Similichlamydia epinepheli]|uniref:class I SAM-dependent methyltransferase n=1 Tax=Candidatus Similichlamydia epinepheli TaxID=1903953 RepID=UPI000D36AECF|nr:class I SAM-dependent methyltransferase [Candidatus Similichlamydia epinepheli]